MNLTKISEEELPPEKFRPDKFKKALKIVIPIAVVILLLGIGTTWYSMSGRVASEKSKAENQTKIADQMKGELEKKVKELESKTIIPKTEPPAPTKTPTAVVKEYVELYKTGSLTKEAQKKYWVSVFDYMTFANATPIGTQNTMPTDFAPTYEEKLGTDVSSYVLMRAKWGTESFNREFVLIKVANEWKIASIRQFMPWPPEESS